METRSTSSTGGQKGVKLERHDLIPATAIQALAVHFGRGARKYDDHQWRKGYEWSKSYSAIQRHLYDWQAGKDFDTCPEDAEGCAFVTAEGEDFIVEPGMEGRQCYNHTGSHQMTCVMWHAAVLLEFYEEHSNFDDRYIPLQQKSYPLPPDSITQSARCETCKDPIYLHGGHNMWLHVFSKLPECYPIQDNSAVAEPEGS